MILNKEYKNNTNIWKAALVIRSITVLFLFASLFTMFVNGAYDFFKCPTDWSLNSYDDTCNAVWPAIISDPNDRTLPLPYNATVAYEKSPAVNYYIAFDICRLQGDAHLPIIQSLTTQLDFYKNLIRHNSSRSIWLGVRRDILDNGTTGKWISLRRRPAVPPDVLFDWDSDLGMPKPNKLCAALSMFGVETVSWGGNNKMISADCNSRHQVICTKPRVPVNKIGAVNGGDPRRLEFVYKGTQDVTFTFTGQRIIDGTMLTLQSAEDSTISLPYKSAPGCDRITTLAGASAPFKLTITKTDSELDGNLTWNKFYCQGSTKCDQATVTVPKDWPFIIGAKYSFCFYVPYPWSSTYRVKSEFSNELLGHNAFVDVVQKYTRYLEDVCSLRKEDIKIFYGGPTDESLPDRGYIPFSERVENSLDIFPPRF